MKWIIIAAFVIAPGIALGDTFALTANNPPRLVALYKSAPSRIATPDGEIANPKAGWKSKDGSHAFVKVNPFVLPVGHETPQDESSTYEIAADGSTVSESRSSQKIGEKPVIVKSLTQKVVEKLVSKDVLTQAEADEFAK